MKCKIQITKYKIQKNIKTKKIVKELIKLNYFIIWWFLYLWFAKYVDQVKANLN